MSKIELFGNVTSLLVWNGSQCITLMLSTTSLAIMKYMSSPKSTAVKDTDIDIADILGQKYQYRIDIGKGDIDPSLISTVKPTTTQRLLLLMQDKTIIAILMQKKYLGYILPVMGK